MPEDIFENEVEVAADIPQQAEVRQYTSSITVGNVTTLPAGSQATVTNTGTESNAILNFGLPQGNDGAGGVWGAVTGDLQDQTDLQTVLSSLAARITSLEASLPPVGTIIAAPKSSVSGYFLCNGQAVSRVTYSSLFAIIGTNFGPGDGTSTFNVPDYRGCFLRGLGASSAADMYTKQAMGAPDITGSFDITKGGYGGSGTATGAFSLSVGSRPGHVAQEGGSSTKATFKASSSNSVYGAADEIRPVNYAVNFFIKY